MVHVVIVLKTVIAGKWNESGVITVEAYPENGYWELGVLEKRN